MQRILSASPGIVTSQGEAYRIVLTEHHNEKGFCLTFQILREYYYDDDEKGYSLHHQFVVQEYDMFTYNNWKEAIKKAWEDFSYFTNSALRGAAGLFYV
jgi:hypothetical protein